MCCEGLWDRLLQTALCTADAHKAEDSLQDDTGWLVYGRGSVWGRKGVQASKLADREERRGGLLPSRESEFLLSHSHIWLAVVKTIAWHLLSLCRWSPSYESASRAASGGESGGLVISCTVNISKLKVFDVVQIIQSFFVMSLFLIVLTIFIIFVFNACFTFVTMTSSLTKMYLCLAFTELTCRRCYADVLSWGSPDFILNLFLFVILHPINSSSTNCNHHLHLFPAQFLSSLPSPWRRSWRVVWPPWIGFLSWPCRQPFARLTPRMPMGQAWARRMPYWILTPHWTRKRFSSTRMANRPTATPASSHLLSTARQRRRWHWARSISGSVITFPTTGRRAVAGRWEKHLLAFVNQFSQLKLYCKLLITFVEELELIFSDLNYYFCSHWAS